MLAWNFSSQDIAPTSRSAVPKTQGFHHLGGSSTLTFENQKELVLPPLTRRRVTLRSDLAVRPIELDI
jgi:hypothetical protein